MMQPKIDDLNSFCSNLELDHTKSWPEISIETHSMNQNVNLKQHKIIIRIIWYRKYIEEW